jgi:hypothetical protein
MSQTDLAMQYADWANPANVTQQLLYHATSHKMPWQQQISFFASADQIG